MKETLQLILEYWYVGYICILFVVIYEKVYYNNRNKGEKHETSK